MSIGKELSVGQIEMGYRSLPLLTGLVLKLNGRRIKIRPLTLRDDSVVSIVEKSSVAEAVYKLSLSVLSLRRTNEVFINCLLLYDL